MSSSPQHSTIIKRTDYLVSTAMLLLSLILLFAAAWLSGAPKTVNESVFQRTQSQALAQCSSNLDSLHIPFKSEANSIIKIASSSVKNLSELAAKSSLIQMSCPGLNVTEACIGSECKEGKGVFMTLSINLSST